MIAYRRRFWPRVAVLYIVCAALVGLSAPLSLAVALAGALWWAER